MQQASSSSGLVPASGANQRFTIALLHNASPTISQGLVALWSGKSAAEAHDILKRPDVSVTNQSDKTSQLAKIAKLNQTIRQALELHEQCGTALQALAAAMAGKDAAALRVALEMACKAQVAPANLSVAIGVAREVGLRRASLAAAQQMVDALQQESAAWSADIRGAVMPTAATTHHEVQQVLDAFTKAQLAANDAFANAHRLAKDKGVEVRLDNRRNTVSVVARSTTDGTSGRILLKNTHVTDDGTGAGARCGSGSSLLKWIRRARTQIVVPE